MSSAWNLVGFDLETADADELFRGNHEGPFVRIAGAIDHETGETKVFTDIEEFLKLLTNARTIYGHNIIGFDLVALAHHHGINFKQFCEKSVDTVLITRQQDPIPTKTQRNNPEFQGQHTLDKWAKRLGHTGKTDDVKALARKWGGFDKIPVDDLEYQAYLEGDLRASRFVLRALISRVDEYVRREHKVTAVQNQMSLNGWRVDTRLLAQRVLEEDMAVDDAAKWLNEKYDMPLGREKGCLVPRLDENGQPTGKKMRGTRWEVFGSPHRTTEGMAALEKAFYSLGVEPPRTEKGSLSTSSDALGDDWVLVGKKRQPGMLRKYPDNPGLKELCEKIVVVSGKARKYQEIHDFLVEDRTHSFIGGVQASGRWAMTKPSVTNIGKRGDKNLSQRAVFLADEGEVLLAFDLDQVDMRAVGALSGDTEYQKLFLSGRKSLVQRCGGEGEKFSAELKELAAKWGGFDKIPEEDPDAHIENAKVFFGDPGRRSDAKAVGHGINYGRGARAIAEAHGLNEREIDKAIRAMSRKYPKLSKWRKEMDSLGQHSFLNNGFGRIMRPDPKHSYTQSPALMGQGATRDLMCEGLLNLPEWIWPMLRAVVHDEVILSVPPEQVEEVKKVVIDSFTMVFLGVNITCGSSDPAVNWRGCYPEK